MKSIKHLARALICTLSVGVAAGQSATNFSFSVNRAVPDGNPMGLTLATNLTVLGGNISAVTVSLDITGGFNGDLYAYLAGPNGGFAMLLNRVGVGTGSSESSFGYRDAGFNITFDDSATNGNIHDYQTVSGYAGLLNGGSWQPDGRNMDPQSSPSLFDTTSPSAFLSSFKGSNPNGTWTLFLADLSGGGQSSVVSWGLGVTTVPEPSTLSFIAMGGLGAILVVRRQRRKTYSR
jgi:subtilisin-like proprotein convertase family protein